MTGRPLLLPAAGRLLLQAGGWLLLQAGVGTPAGAWVAPALWRTWAAPGLGRGWKGGAVATSCGTVEKTPGDRVWLEFDFGDLPEVLAGAALGVPAVAVAPPGGVTVAGVAAVGGYRVGGWYAGGADGASYAVTCTVPLAGGAVIARTGTLSVRSQ